MNYTSWCGMCSLRAHVWIYFMVAAFIPTPQELHMYVIVQLVYYILNRSYCYIELLNKGANRRSENPLSFTSTASKKN